MTQAERRAFLIEYLLSERGERINIPADEYNQKRLLRSLFNIRMPRETSEDFLRIQDEYLQEENRRKGITDIADLQPVQDDIYLWQGDITTLKCGAIVNAANSQMLGCFQPCHGCIDNAIHTFSGIQLRRDCNEIMLRQGFNEPTGQAKITPAYNLPCQYVIHTVGPIVSGRLTEKDCELLKSCYLSCLKLAEENGVESIAFCCISTGVFGFPQREAARIAVDTVKVYKTQTGSSIKVIFNVFKNEDLFIYRELLANEQQI
ncbi:MAG: protein-ADP-ribose hydrolase [Ruminococcus sp.]|uniref:protein-ADP-ribose hydrolase n=1 Tax=Ruminococcus sp. TaxID=41978 RepID=UPI0028737ED4|nr:protein-ADP-ribose hydrolase [Ruminococcus sp.]MBQ3284809.1 protein-ADP-ribose hydrolase [Ruminococcus sp.]